MVRPTPQGEVADGSSRYTNHLEFDHSSPPFSREWLCPLASQSPKPAGRRDET